MENVNRWYFTKDQLANTPSRKSGIPSSKELHYRQQAANFIQDMGQRLQVSQLCINTAIVYMHRFYVFHSFVDVHRNSLSVAALFLAAKVEEQPRKLEHVIKVAHACLHKDSPPLDVKSPAYAEKQLEVVVHENVLLQTLGFVLAIEHPHTYVVKVCQLVKASKDLAQTSYFMATTSLHMTTMCLQYKPTVVACVCIHLACKWASWKIEPCSEGKEWYYYVDKSVTLDLLEALTQEFIAILETSPHKFKRFAPKDGTSSHVRSSTDESSKHSVENKVALTKKDVSSPGPSASTSFSSSQPEEKPVIKQENSEKHATMPPSLLKQPSPSVKNKVVSTHSISLDVYREKKEKERLEQKLASNPPVEVSSHLPTVVKPHHVLNEPEKAGKSAPKPAEHQPHAKDKDRGVRNHKEHQVHSTSNSKVNHQLPKVNSEVTYSTESKTSAPKLPSTASNDPIVVLERMDVHSETQESGEIISSVQKVVDNVDVKTTYQVENECDATVPPVAPHSPVLVHTKSKHQKHRTNSVHNSHTSAQQIPHKQSPVKDIKTNGSKTDITERNIVENSLKNADAPVKHEKREKHKSKHSSSKEKSVSNNTEHSNPSIKVKIRKDIICLPEIHQKPSVVSEGQKKLKIKLPKPPPPPPQPETPIKLVITKDKSGTGSYSTSHKNRESKKRAHSPQGQSKGLGEAVTKYAKLEHSHANIKQSKSMRHSSSRNLDHGSNDIGSLHSDSESYHHVDGGQTYYANNQYLSSQGMNPSVRSKTHPPLPPPLPPQPPPPPPQ